MAAHIVKEIFAKQAMRDQLRLRSGLASHDAAAPEPLFLFAQATADRGRVPATIQRLLIEWADQPEDLGAVSYAFLPSDRVPNGVFAPGTCLHLVAASTTLGHAGPYSVGARRGFGVQSAVLVLGQLVPGLRAIHRVHSLCHRRQQSPHRHPRAVQPGLHGSQRHLGEGGDFLI